MAKREYTEIQQVYMKLKMKSQLDKWFGRNGLLPMKTSQFIIDATQDWVKQLSEGLDILSKASVPLTNQTVALNYLFEHADINPTVSEYAVQIFLAQRK